MGILCLIMRSEVLDQATYDAGGWHPPRGLYLQPHEIDYRPIDTDWNFKNVRSSFWRLYINDRGGAWLSLADGQPYVLTADHVHLVPAWVRFSCHNQRRLKSLYVHFDVIGLPGIILRRMFEAPLQVGVTQWFEPMLGALRRRPWRTGGDPLAGLCQVQALIYLAVARAWLRLTPAQARACRDFLHQAHGLAPVLQHIEAHLDQSLHNAVLARLCYLSRDHFVRRFHQQMGQTPASYVRERRISRAAELLLLSPYNIKQIASATGFGDRFHFTRVFAKLMGAAPAAYRRTERILSGKRARPG